MGLHQFPEPPKKPNSAVMKGIERFVTRLAMQINAESDRITFRKEFDDFFTGFGRDLQASKRDIDMDHDSSRVNLKSYMAKGRRCPAAALPRFLDQFASVMQRHLQ